MSSSLVYGVILGGLHLNGAGERYGLGVFGRGLDERDPVSGLGTLLAGRDVVCDEPGRGFGN